MSVKKIHTYINSSLHCATLWNLKLTHSVYTNLCHMSHKAECYSARRANLRVKYRKITGVYCEVITDT